MVKMLSIAMALGVMIWSFFSPVWAWTPLIVAATLIVVTLLGLKKKKWRYVDELSSDANDLLQRFGHYYAMPFAGRDFSAATSTLMFAAVGVGIIGALKGFWWGLLIAVAFWFILGPVAMAFNPTSFLRDPLHQRAHEEIIQWLLSRSGRQRG